MLASYRENLNIEDQYIIRDESFHHLVHVLRVKLNNEVLLLNGKGLLIKTQVLEISKKELILKFIESRTEQRRFKLDLLLGMPKKEALDLCLKEATELGIRKIILMKSDFSQMKFPDRERAQKVLISALEQSNSAYMPTLEFKQWDEISFDQYTYSLFLNSQEDGAETIPADEVQPEVLLIIGPEGGFSEAELSFLKLQKNVKSINLPTGILRTPTALATGVGLVILKIA